MSGAGTPGGVSIQKAAVWMQKCLRRVRSVSISGLLLFSVGLSFLALPLRADNRNSPLPTVTASLSGPSSRLKFSASVTSQDPIKVVRFFVDGELIAAETKAPYHIFWDSTPASPGNHKLVAVAITTMNRASRSKSVAFTTKSTGRSATTSESAAAVVLNLYNPRMGDSYNVGDAVDCIGSYECDFELVLRWDFGDGVRASGLELTSTRHSYSLANPSPGYVIQFSGGTAFKTVTIKVNSVAVAVPPSITQPPQSATVCAGQSATYSVTATGSAPLSYQWYKNGSPIGDATAASYTTPATTANDNNSTFSVVVTNAADNTPPSAATLTVNVRPNIDTQPQSATVKAGASATFSVTATGSGVLSYQWKKNGSPVGSNSNIYTTQPVTANDNQSTYSVDVSNSCGPTPSVNATLTVEESPSLPVIPSTDPQDQTVNAGQRATFTVSATGTNLRYQWKKGIDDIPGATGPAYTTPVTTPADNGSRFWVVVSNDAGSVSSRKATLMVRSAPVFRTQPADANVKAGETASFSVSVGGVPTPTLQWERSNNGGTTWTPVSGATSPTYSFTMQATDADAKFRVKATNIVAGTDSNIATLTLKTILSLKWKRQVIYMGGKQVGEYTSEGFTPVMTEHLGTPRVILNTNGSRKAEQKFLPYGESMHNPTTAAMLTKGYTNHEQTDASGVIYMQARFYLPMYGRFASPDPARDQHFEQTQSWNIYSYVQNNPIMNTDPTGMLTWKEAWNYTKDVGRALVGEAKGVASVGVGIAKAVAHPVDTAKALGNAVAHPVATAKAVGNAVSSAVANANTPEQAGKLVGNALANIGLVAAPFASAAGGAGEVANAAAITERAGATSWLEPALGETRVTRWMGEAESVAMKDTGNLQFGAGGRSYVTELGAPQPGGTGPVQVNFNVPTGSLQPAGNQGWYQILDAKRPPVTAIEVVK